MGNVYRRLVLEATCLMSTAFDLGPSLLDSNVFQQLLCLLRIVVAGASGFRTQPPHDPLVFQVDLLMPSRFFQCSSLQVTQRYVAWCGITTLTSLSL